MTFTIGLVLTAVATAMLLLNLYSTLLCLMHFRRGSKVPASLPFYHPVSVLKPLKGIDNGIEENLESFFHLDYPEFELIFSVADIRDPACALVRRLQIRYSGVSSRLIVGDVEAGPNPKVNNLIRSYDSAKYDVMLISDSNVRVRPDYLRRVVEDFDPNVGIVTAAASGHSPKGLGGHLEMIYLDTFFARWMVVAKAWGNPIVLGKSMLFRRSAADRFGGIQNLSQFLAEDHMAGQAMRQLGLEIRVMRNPVEQVIGRNSFKSFWDRHVRWGRMRKAGAPLALFFEPLSRAAASGILGAIGFHMLFGISPWVYLAAHTAAFFVIDLPLLMRLDMEFTFMTPIYWLIREALALPMWAQILAGNTVSWRGNKFRLEAGGTIAQIPQQ